MTKYLYGFRYVFLGILCLFIVLSKPCLLTAQTPNEKSQHSQAQFLTKKGFEQLNQGQSSEAVNTWKEAEKIYRRIHLDDGVAGSLINQSLALKALGLYPDTCDILLKALKIDKPICNSTVEQSSNSTKEVLMAAIHQLNPTPVNLLGLEKLGEALHLIGNLNESEIILQETLLITQNIFPKKDVSSILFLWGNTKEAMYERRKNQYIWIEEITEHQKNINQIKKEALASLDYYQQVNYLVNAPQSTKLQSQLRCLNLLLDFDKWLRTEFKSGNDTLATTQTQINQQIQPLIKLIFKNSFLFDELPASTSIFAKLNFAESLNETSNKQLQSLAIQYTESAFQAAKSIDSRRLESYSLGTLGKLQPEASQRYFEKALLFAQSINAWDIAYEWQQQLGNLYKKQGKTEAALQAYDAAIKNLTHIRGNLLANNPDTPFFFYEKVEPVYRNYMRLLLANLNPDLEKVVKVNEGLQTAELENYLQCGNFDLVALNNLKNLANIPPIIHIIDLGDIIEVIVQSPDKSLHHHSVEPKLVRLNADYLLQTLQDRNFANTSSDGILPYSQALYNSLIAPVKEYLPLDGTLVFTLDTSLQSLPMGLLHDGKNYLLQQYSITETLGSKVRQPKFLNKEQLIVLIAGLSKLSPSLNGLNSPKGMRVLPEVAAEVANIKEETKSSLSLLNEKFTYKRFQEELSTGHFPIIHLTTHAQFSSLPQQTMFFSWDKPINLLEFDSLLKQKNQTSEDAIELLVLSACETAKGNKRSALGIAGIAAQAGARSTVATLWRVDDKSTALLIKEFYKELKDGKTKAEALRLAQLSLLSNPDYSHPYYWAGFLLVGGWL
ncbi:CHAT domain-containing protein (plasmid) [Nostoc sp. UHCC 0926]|uniref:CHAT domain-containing protein n=1 Tax=Nostoc sp. UHCC 0926 TaxID=3025190 RepID=UPI00235E6C7C|nr:CHAT domain-containing protein [Nostoc sp. UHCC 0926]WDD36186.1 CHAT domain-containing protein [Nostoc sp. UHCC 0926]